MSSDTDTKTLRGELSHLTANVTCTDGSRGHAWLECVPFEGNWTPSEDPAARALKLRGDVTVACTWNNTQMLETACRLGARFDTLRHDIDSALNAIVALAPYAYLEE